MPAPKPAAPSQGPRIALVYQRPVDDPYSGGSTHVREFIRRLSECAPVNVIAPIPSPGGLSTRPDTLLVSVSNIIRANLAACRFVWSELLRRPNERVSSYVLFDIYAAVVPFLWALVSRTPVAYYPQDLGRQIIQQFRQRGYRGASLLGLFRALPEFLLLNYSTLVIALSDEMAKSLTLAGLSSSRILTCAIKRSPPTAEPERILEWKHRLGTDSKLGVIFVGNLNYPPNLDGAEFIASTILPACRSLSDRLVFVMVGKGTEAFTRDGPPRLIGLGPVLDISSVYFSCHVGLAPVVISGGTSGKIVDYLIHGLRVLATNEAARGVVRSDRVTCRPRQDFPRALLELSSEIDCGPATYGRELPEDLRHAYLESGEVQQLVLRMQQPSVDIAKAGTS